MPGCSASSGRTPVALFAWGLLAGHPLWHAALDAGPDRRSAPSSPRARRFSRRNRAVAVCVGLLTSSAVVVHLMNGAIEGHFHFFVMVSVLALYEEWFPYLLAFAFVLGHHGLMGAVEPGLGLQPPRRDRAPVALGGDPRALHRRAGDRQRRALAPERGRARRRACTAASASATPSTTRRSAWRSRGLDGVVQRANAALCERLGADPAGRPLADLVDADDLGGRPFPAAGGEIEVRYRDAGAWGLWHHSLLTGRDGRPEAWISHCIDVSKRRLAEEELSWQANHDALTGLPNRELFLERLSGSLGSERPASPCCSSTSTTSRSSTTRSATAPAIACSAAWPSGCAASCARATSSPASAATSSPSCCPGITSEAYALGVARRLAEALREPLVLDGERRYVTASVGVSFSGAQRATIPTRCCATPTRRCTAPRRLGKSRCEVFDDSMRERAMERLELESGLRHALDDGELRLVYQPLVTLDDGRVTRRRGAAALGPPDLRHRRAAALHLAGRAQRAHHPHRRVGPARGVPASSPPGATTR